MSDMEEQNMVVLAPESRSILEGLRVVRETLAPDLTDGELQLFALVSARSGLDPFARQIYAVKRKGRMTIQTGIDGYRSIAARTGEYDGQDEPTFGPDCSCGKEPKPHPESATVRVYRKGVSRAFGATAYWHEYIPQDSPFMWIRMPHVMVSKVAEALALRKAFPWDPTSRTGIGSDIYTTEEMEQAANSSPAPSLVERVQAKADGAGISLRYFAEAARGMDPGEIVARREEMFPDAKGVSSLTDVQRAALLDRLLNGDGEEVPEEDGSPLDVEAVEGVVVEFPGTCGDVATDPVMAGASCSLPSDHKGAHKSEEGSWPR